MIFAWGAGGVALTLAEAGLRLGARFAHHAVAGLSPLAWCFAAVSIAAFGYGEGVIALGRRFAPVVALRARRHAESASGVAALALAPLHAAGLLGGTRRTRSRAWLAVFLIGCAIAGVHKLPDVARAIVDGGVAAAMLVGTAMTIREMTRTWPRCIAPETGRRESIAHMLVRSRPRYRVRRISTAPRSGTFRIGRRTPAPVVARVVARG